MYGSKHHYHHHRPLCCCQMWTITQALSSRRLFLHAGCFFLPHTDGWLLWPWFWSDQLLFSVTEALSCSTPAPLAPWLSLLAAGAWQPCSWISSSAQHTSVSWAVRYRGTGRSDGSQNHLLRLMISVSYLVVFCVSCHICWLRLKLIYTSAKEASCKTT